MSKEAYVTIEIAKLLKEQGFEWECNRYYYDGEYYFATISDNWNDDTGLVSIPTHQMARAWLREIKNIVIIPEIHTTIDLEDYYWVACIHYLDKPWDLVEYMTEPSVGKYEGYNKVIEAALKYSLENLVK